MTEATSVEAAHEVLYGVPLEAFIDERKRLARQLRDSGDRPGATSLAKLRKPSAAAWALNRVAREAPDVVAEWFAASAELRDASARPAEVGGEAVRAAIVAHRTATTSLLEVVRERAQPSGRPLSEDMVDRARNLLLSATSDAGVAEFLRRGRMSDEPAAARDPEVAPEPPSASAPTASRAAQAAEKARDASAEEQAAAQAQREHDARLRAERTAELERRIAEAVVEAERTADAHADRVTAAGKADKRLASAQRALERAASEAEATHAAVQEIERPLRAAEARLEALRAELEAARGRT